MKNNDDALIQDVLDGDDTAFATLVKKHHKSVHALVWRKIGDFHIAEEITQDTFLKAYQRLSTLKEPQRFLSWLYVIATNRCKAWHRKKRLWTQPLDKASNSELEKSAYSNYVIEQNKRKLAETQQEVVKKLLAKLPESDRTVITLYYLAEMSYEEISNFLGVSEAAIRNRLYRARRRLKKEETMIREALEHFQLSPNLTDNIMREVSRLKPAAPSTSKPIIPWVIGATSAVLIALMFGIGGQFLAHFQKPYSLDAQSETSVEIVNAQVVQNFEVKSDNRNQSGNRTDLGGRNDGNDENTKQVIGNGDGDYTRWNLPERAKARLSKGRINGINFSPDGTQIAVGSATGVWIYDVRTGAELALLTDHTSRTGEVVFSPDGKTLATGLNSKILLWNTATGKLLKTFKIIEDGVVKALRFIDDGKTLRCDYYDGSVRLWDITTGVKKDFRPAPPRGLKGIPRHIMGQEVTAADLYLNNVDNKGIFAVGEIDGKIRLDDAMTGQHLKTLQDHKNRISKLLFSPDGTLLVSNAYNQAPLRLWDVTTGKLLKTLTKDLDIHRQILNFSKDGKTLACSAWMRKTGDRKIELWDVATKTLRTTLFTKLDSNIHHLAFSLDSKTVATVNWNDEIQVWDVNTGKELSSFTTNHTPGSTTLAFSSDSTILASGQGKTIRLWDTFNFTELSHHIDTDTGIITIVLSPNGRILTGVSDFRIEIKRGNDSVIETVRGRLHVWETHTGNKLSETPVESHKGDGPEHPEQNFNSSAYLGMYNPSIFSKNGHLLATVINKRGEHMLMTNPNSEWANNRFTVHLWAVPYEKSHATLKGHTKKINVLAFTHNGKMIASGSDDGTIRLWNTSTGTQMLSIPSRKTNSLAFSEDGKILASSNPVNIQLWDVGTGTQLKSLKAENDSVTVLTFSTDSNILACGNRDGTIRLWDLSTGNELTTFKGHVDRINALSFSSDGKMLASSSVDGAIFLWNISA